MTSKPARVASAPSTAFAPLGAPWSVVVVSGTLHVCLPGGAMAPLDDVAAMALAAALVRAVADR